MFINKILQLIDSKGITKNRMLKDLSISKNSIENWSNRGNIPPGDVVAKIATYFNVSTDYLLGLTDNPNQTITNFTENEQDVLKILHSIPDERQQAKFIGYMEAESKKYVNASNGIADDITETLKQAQDSQAVTKQK